MNKQRVRPIMGEPFDVNKIGVEEEISALVQETHDTSRDGPDTFGIRRRAIDSLDRPSPASGSQNNLPLTEEDPINPSHYRRHPSGVECIDITEHMSFNAGNAVKYIWRMMDKGDPLENLKKAQWYIEREILRLTRVR